MQRLITCISGAVALLAVAGCASSSTLHGRGVVLPAPTAERTATDTSYDWHSLVLLPFGTVLKDSPIRLREVLLFRAELHGAAETSGGDCYTVDARPRFIDRRPDEYLLCFDHDQLNRIDVSVRLAADEAVRVFVRACVLWRKQSMPPALPDSPTPGSDGSCEVRDGNVIFNAHLVHESNEPTALFSATLTPAAASGALPDATHAGPSAAHDQKR